MVKDYQESVWSARGLAFKLAALAVATISLPAMGFFMLHLFQTPAQPPNGVAADGQPPATQQLFRGWPKTKPDLVLVLTGQMHGYLKECGCSRPQLGSLDRRYSFLSSLVKQRDWPLVSFDLGDLAQTFGPQRLLKYRYSMMALDKLHYSGVGIGLNETALPLFDALGEYAANNPHPRVLIANLIQKDGFPGDLVAPGYIKGMKNGPTVGASCVVAPSVASEVRDPAVKFDPYEKVLPGVLGDLQKQKPEILLLLFHGKEAEAKECAKKFPQFHVILCLCDQEEPPSKPEMVGTTMIVSVGHKGRYLGLVGAFRTGNAAKPFDFHYQLVAMGEEYITPKGKEAENPIFALLEDYSKEVKIGNYLAKYPKTRHDIQRDPNFKDAKYVGSEKCKRCHEEEYKIWKASPHSHAYQSLVDATRPSLRQFDGECVKCHVTGFEYNTGFTDEKTTPRLLDNGCENCHGPASIHVFHQENGIKNAASQSLLKLMNPIKTPPNETPAAKDRRINVKLNNLCMKCHDIDNDVNWDPKKWETGKIIHGGKAK